MVACYAAMHLPDDWRAALERLLDEDWRRLVILGGVDTGKSTLATQLLDKLHEQDRSAALLDADLGQKMVGPPACVTLGQTNGDGALRLRRLCFLGQTDPAPAMAGVVAAVARLCDGETTDRLVVNTSGFVSGPGVSLKRCKLDVLEPDRVIVLGEAEALETVLRSLRPDRVLRLGIPPDVRRKSPTVREAARALSLRDALRGAVETTLPGVPVDELIPLRSPLAPGSRRLCGLADAEGEDLGIGLVAADSLKDEPRFSPPSTRRVCAVCG